MEFLVKTIENNWLNIMIHMSPKWGNYDGSENRQNAPKRSPWWTKREGNFPRKERLGKESPKSPF